MTRTEVRNALHGLVGDWRKVDRIFEIMGKLSPEREFNRPPWKTVPKYDPKLVRRVGTLLQREKFDKETHEAARALLAHLELDLE